MGEVTSLRLRTLLARARGDDAAYRDLVSRYHAMGEIAWLRRTHRLAQAMIESRE
jgi:hypothetical protein